MAIPLYNIIENDSDIHDFSNFSVPRVQRLGTYCDEVVLIIEEYKDTLYFIYSDRRTDVVSFDVKLKKKHIIKNSGMLGTRIGKVNHARIGKMLWVSMYVCMCIFRICIYYYYYNVI